MTTPRIFDRSLLSARRRRAEKLGFEDFLIARAADDLSERLSVVLRRFTLAADLGTPSDTLRRVLLEKQLVEHIVAVDPQGPRTGGQKLKIVADEEALPFRDGALDLVVSALALHAVNDLPGTLVQVRRALKPDGLFMAALFGGDTLAELREAFAIAESETEGGVSPRVAPFADVAAFGQLLQRAGFALPVVDSERILVRYATPFALMADLRRMGATNVLLERRRVPLRRKTLMRMAEIYAERFADADGRLRATFELVWLSGWAPDASQQQPLKPGSARMRLADALRTQELPAGEKSGR